MHHLRNLPTGRFVWWGMNLTVRIFLFGAALAVVTLLPLRADIASTPADGSTTNAGAANGQGSQRLKNLLQQLNLSDTQKQQIKQIRATVTDKKTRHREIWQVLTPEQRETLKSLRQQRQAQGQDNGSENNQG